MICCPIDQFKLVLHEKEQSDHSRVQNDANNSHGLDLGMPSYCFVISFKFAIKAVTCSPIDQFKFVSREKKQSYHCRIQNDVNNSHNSRLEKPYCRSVISFKFANKLVVYSPTDSFKFVQHEKEHSYHSRVQNDENNPNKSCFKITFLLFCYSVQFYKQRGDLSSHCFIQVFLA